ncbi:MAG: EAL domain-containing protein [Aquabacterium sp.]|jgi:diguanylate cyclase (GGDEF)-like protein/PAS domain S-box-containing protein|uniref:putative bifunctional diguanylate cyclase/phosphodiesterase n=1 Tax=Aquabacterium sp. TaxID=1872578 RepID=UPI002A36EAF0|nr:EAL domain-containing protein [Aquabacterium sp.]MDX9843990.1 EAL domain-containing protein [Aquabacterium sp.]
MTHARAPRSFARQIGYTLATLSAMIVAFAVYTNAEKAIDGANEARLRAFLLADELHQSSDDLTRMARLYVASQHPQARQHYQRILDIRDGLHPRPQGYSGIYWDLVLVDGQAPRPDSTERIPLMELMRQAGFPSEELDILIHAKAHSDRLSQIERKAMTLCDIEGPGAEARRAQALQMLHDARYLAAKAAILAPIDRVNTLMRARTHQAVAQAERRALYARGALIACGLILMAMLFRAAQMLRRVLGGSVDDVHAQIARIGQGHFTPTRSAQDAPEGSLLARLIDTQRKLQDLSAEREHTQTELHRSETRLLEAQRLAQLGHWELDLRTHAMQWSHEVYRIFEQDPARFVPSCETILTLIHPDDRERVDRDFQAALRSRTPCEIAYRLQHRDGRVKFIHQRCEPLFDEQGQAPQIIGTMQDVSHSKQTERALQRLNRDLRLLSDCNMALVHAQDEPTLLNEICRLSVERGGYSLAWVGFAQQDEERSVRVAAECGDRSGYLAQVNISWADTARGRGVVGTAIRTGQPSLVTDIPHDPRMQPWAAKAAELALQSCVALPLICDARVLGALTLYAREPDAFDTDELNLLMELANDLAYGISALRARAEHAEAKARVDFLSHYDPLTHLPNRLLLGDRFAHAANVARSEHRTLTLLYLDLDHFKHINDSLGYAVGDQVLVLCVERLRQCLPPSATISRMSGDEFVVLLTGPDDLARIAGLADTVSKAFAEPFQVGEHALNASCSIGIALFPADGGDFDTLFRHAHTAVNSAKEAGRNAYRFFSHEMNAGLVDQIRLTGALAQAVRRQEFRLHYQPQLDLRTGRIVGVEALVRWQHPEAGLLPPGQFIALAERSGHIIPMGEWVLREACRQGRLWADALAQPPVVAVNLSALQFKRGDVLALVRDALQSSGLPAHLLELELTESILLQDVDSTIATLQGLKALGVKLSIDDFGTGYSSLSYLKRLAVDKLKIDQSFVHDMLTDADGASIVQAIVQLGHTLQLTVIAEGVETEAQRLALTKIGCDEAQGYLIGRPVPAETCQALLTRV